MSIPTQLTAGDSLRLSIPSRGRTVADGWALTLVLVPVAGGERYTVASSAADPDNPGNHLLTAATTVTAPWRTGDYTWVQQVGKTGERKTIASGRLSVAPDPAAAGGTSAIDLRSVARKALDAIDAYLVDATNLKAASYSINGRNLSRYTRAELLAERSKWQAEVAREQAAAAVAAGGFDPRRTYVRFVRP